MVDKAIIIKNKIKEMEKNGKRKMSFPGQSLGSNTRPRLPQSGPFSEYGSSADAWTTSSIPDAEALATGSST
jgi:hypothetical protein